ncbi:hypothetical protein ACFPM0_13580 [Pseudonocardia sulfidoxydans]|uniref:hypothetical protein n=1 Tax=Pseudonocardia sulfidoxydans TaxID=54011 RepID=UPI00361DFE0C
MVVPTCAPRTGRNLTVVLGPPDSSEVARGGKRPADAPARPARGRTDPEGRPPAPCEWR